MVNLKWAKQKMRNVERKKVQVFCQLSMLYEHPTGEQEVKVQKNSAGQEWSLWVGVALTVKKRLNRGVHLIWGRIFWVGILLIHS